MNIRFASGSVRFRVDREEFATLAAGRAVTMRVKLPGQHAFNASITPDRFGSWRLDNDPTGFWLAVPAGDLKALAEVLPTAEGLAHRFELDGGSSVEVVFEVDVREQA